MSHFFNSHRRGFTTALALLALSVTVASSAAQTSPAVVKALEEAETLMEQGDYEAAIAALKKAEKRSSEPSVRVLLDLARCFRAIREFEESQSYARKASALAKEPRDQAAAFNLLGLSLLESLWDRVPGARPIPDELVEAEAAFRKVLDVSDGQANTARHSLGEVLIRQGRYAEAHAALAEYLEGQPEGEHSAQARTAMEWLACMQLGPEAEVGLDDDLEDSSGGESPLPIAVDGEVQAPVKCFAPPPRYTENARKARIEGAVVVEAIIDKRGDVTDVKVLKSLPEYLDREAVRAVRKWKFRPATLDGKPVAVIYNLTINFWLEKRPDAPRRDSS